MTPAKTCKEAGLSGLGAVVDATGLSRQTLGNWHKARPLAFRVLILGTIALLKEKNDEL